MNDIEKCPYCSKTPRVKQWTYEDDDMSVYCCGVTVDGGRKQWNQYCAAMELAKAALQRDATDMMDAPASTSGSNFFQVKLCRVLEVFGK